MSDSAWGGYAGVMTVFMMTMAVASCATVGIPMKRIAAEDGSCTEKQNRWVRKVIHSLLECNCRKHC